MKNKGGHHDRTSRFYACRFFFANPRRAESCFDFSFIKSPIASTTESFGLGRVGNGDGQALAQSRQECRWWTRVIISGCVLCALAGVAVGQVFELASDGRVQRGIRGGTRVFGSRGEIDIASQRPLFDSAGAGRLGRGGVHRSDAVDRQRSGSLWVCTHGNTFIGHDRASAVNRLSARSRDLKRSSSKSRSGSLKVKESRDRLCRGVRARK